MFRHFSSSEFHKGWKNISQIPRGICDLSLRNKARTTDNEGYTDPVFNGFRLSPGYLPAIQPAVYRHRRAVVGREYYQCIFPQTQLFKRLFKPPDNDIYIPDHRFMTGVFIRYIRFGRCGGKGQMGQTHGIIQKHRIFPVSLHEIDKKFSKNILSEAAFKGFTSILCVYIRIPVPFGTCRISCFESRPHAIIIKSVRNHSFWLYPEVVDLPFPCRSRFVARRLHGKGNARVFLPVELRSSAPAGNIPVIDPSVTERILSGKKSYPRRGALRHRVKTLKGQACIRQTINIRGFYSFCPIGTHPLFTHVIRKNE